MVSGYRWSQEQVSPYNVVYCMRASVVDLLLEESPKWHLLSMVLDEIRKEGTSNSDGIFLACKFKVVQ